VSRPDGPTVDDDDLPFVHHPIEYLPWLVPGEVQAFQLRPTLENRLAEWCGGETAVEEGRIVVLIPGPPALTVRQGDWVVYDGERYRVEPAGGFNTRYWPRGVDPGWSHRCYASWETP
jgi:hypothetical protein